MSGQAPLAGLGFPEKHQSSLREKLWAILDPELGEGWVNTCFDVGIISLVLMNVAALVAETMETFAAWRTAFDRFEQFCLAVFTIEYLARLWACTAVDRYRRPIRGRLRFMVTPMAIVDLIAISPLFLSFFGSQAMMLRVVRLVRILRLLKIFNYYDSLAIIREALRRCRGIIAMSALLMLIILLLMGTVMYEIENDEQPDVFKDIPSGLWWATVTMSTVGYGDIYPKTLGGKVGTALALVLGIGLVGLPAASFAGSVASVLSERQEERRKKKAREKQPPPSQPPPAGATHACPHCGKPIALAIRGPNRR